MKKSFPLNHKSNETCLCQCNIPNNLFYHLDYCCCPIFCCRHEYSSNMNTNSYPTLESPRFIIPHKEKCFSINSERRNKKPNILDKMKISAPFLRNKGENNLNFKSNTENNDIDINSNKNIKNDDDNNIYKIKIIKDKKNKKLFKKIKVNTNNKERIFNINIPNTTRHKTSQDINDFNPNNISLNKKGKNINNFDLNKNNSSIDEIKMSKIFVNKNTKILEYPNIAKKNNRLNLTNIHSNKENSNIIFNSSFGNKFKISDKNDDIMNIKQYHYTTEANDNKKILQNLKIEIDKAKDMIDNLKKENKNLKNKLGTKLQNNSEKILIENKKEISMKTDVLYLKNDIQDIKNKLKEYENIIDLLKKKNDEQKLIIENQKKEILELIIKIGNYEKSKQNNEPDSFQEKINISNECNNYKKINENLKIEIINLKKIIENKNDKIKEFEIKLKYEKNINNKKQKILELLFNFYLNLKKCINFDQSKESLKEIIDIITIDDFENKLNKVEKRIKQIIENIQIKFGHCFACDIACCTSHVDKLKTFRYKNPKKKK